MKELKENLRTMKSYATADTANAEGFAAWTPSDVTLLEQFSMTGSLGNSFYADSKETTKEAAALLERADANDLAAAIVRGRNDGFIRSFPILGLVYLSMKDTALFNETFGKVVLTGNDLEDFIEMAKAIRGLGRSIKRTVCEWIKKNTTTYYAQKYRRQLADAIRLVRFKGEDSIYSYILAAYKNVKGNTDEKLERAYREYPDLAAQRDFVAAIESGDTEKAHSILAEKDVEVNSLTALYGKFDRALWASVAAKSPVMRYLKYMGKFCQEGVLDEGTVKSKINVEALRKAKVFPFRLYAAYGAIKWKLQKDAPWALEYLAKVIDEYAARYDWREFDVGDWVVAPDVSGSMSSPIGGSSSLTYATLSAMFCGFFIKGINRVKVIPWDTEVHAYDVPADKPVLEHIHAIESMVGGGTYMETAVRHMLSHSVKADYAVFLTDTEEYGRGWLAAWKEYHKKNPDAVAFILRGDSYVSQPIDDRTAKELNVYQIFGWNDSAIDYIKFIIRQLKNEKQ